ncbi:hypothetical protein [Demequina sp.]|uniref:hypothetical protein n=1 Tax=Demequina sp. TaxID=2050685 RepID=UPI003D0B9688
MATTVSIEELATLLPTLIKHRPRHQLAIVHVTDTAHVAGASIVALDALADPTQRDRYIERVIRDLPSDTTSTIAITYTGLPHAVFAPIVEDALASIARAVPIDARLIVAGGIATDLDGLNVRALPGAIIDATQPHSAPAAHTVTRATRLYTTATQDDGLATLADVTAAVLNGDDVTVTAQTAANLARLASTLHGRDALLLSLTTDNSNDPAIRAVATNHPTATQAAARILEAILDPNAPRPDTERARRHAAMLWQALALTTDVPARIGLATALAHLAFTVDEVTTTERIAIEYRLDYEGEHARAINLLGILAFAVDRGMRPGWADR